jgi:hypothetical protein
MHEHASDPCEALFHAWQYRREVVESYFHALRLLIPLDSRAGSHLQRESVRELNEQLATALLALRRASDELRSCEQELAVLH